MKHGDNLILLNGVTMRHIITYLASIICFFSVNLYAETHITLLHTNDIHSHLLPSTISKQPKQGGIARIKTLITETRQRHGDDQVLLLDAGDYSQGSIFYNLWKGAEAVMWLNDFNYDAVTLGNHEFDLGVQNLADRFNGIPISITKQQYSTEKLTIPVVCANLEIAKNSPLSNWVKPSIIIQKGQQRFGIIGLVTDTTRFISQVDDSVKFLPYVDSVRREVKHLKAQGINKIILVSHYGYEVDKRYSQELTDIDVIVSGHDHALLATTAQLNQQDISIQQSDVQGDYPTVVKNAQGKNVLLVSAMEWGRWLGQLHLTFNDAGELTNWRGEPVLVRGCENGQCDQAIPADEHLTRKLSHYQEPLQQYQRMVIGKVGQDFTAERGQLRHQEMPIGNLLTNSILAATQKKHNADAVIINSGGIRSALNKGTLTYADLLMVLPFSNQIYIAELTGKQLIATLDHGLSHAQGKSSGSFPQIAGMQLHYCKQGCAHTLLPKGRVTALKINQISVDLTQKYRVALPAFLAKGGDFYTVVKTACENTAQHCYNTFDIFIDVAMGYIKANSPIMHPLQGRIIAE